MKCKQCKFYSVLGKAYSDEEIYLRYGECWNKAVYNPPGETLVMAGGSDDEPDRDFFYVNENFGCIKFEVPS